MKRLSFSFALLVCLPGFVYAAPRDAEMPELSQLGPHAIGTLVTTTALASRAATAATVAGRSAERTIAYRVWYPATVATTAPRVRYRHSLTRVGRQPLPLITGGIAVENARVASGDFPLVVMSHGFGGWSTRFAALAETLASRGYVVASIDHRDRSAADAASFIAAFGEVLVHRAQDQRAVIADLRRRAGRDRAGFATAIDPSTIGIIGYSMGGYGALATAGARYDAQARPFEALSADARAALAEDNTTSPAVKALVAIAPWGGAPDTRVWTAEALAKVTVPVLIITGSEDDIVDYRTGVRWISDQLKASVRRILVFREARHNILGDRWSGVPDDDFASREFFSEPVWRSERIAAINAHFIVAFLDGALKRDATRARWLDVATTDANVGTWPQASGSGPGSVAGDAQPGYWRGFQRRWALGLELHRAVPEQR